ncbi:MAG: asparagine synthase (glutamine-hydrolyzing) [Nanoarchaeota archaeon]
MCGILGFNWEDTRLLRKSLLTIEHRGPDALGTFFDRGISLGHRRLSILDLSRAGKQPMSNEDGTIWIVFNGEIYNFEKLKSKLKQRHIFKSRTDTELLIHLYEEEGTKMVEKLEGMFAFCIYDSKKKILFLARDKAGIKPLYYYSYQNKFIFCSEIKGLLEEQSIEREVNKEALVSYLMFRANTSKETFFKNIFKLSAGHVLLYNLKNKTHTIKKYWDYTPSPTNISLEEATKKLRSLLEDSVKGQLMSDVPYGMYLSGGVDSGAIATLVKKHATQPLRSFSVGFTEEEHNETKEARFLAEHIGSEHRELLIDKKDIKHLPEIVYQGDEPMSDPTALPIYLLSQMAKKHCTVILTGEGADELFAGYPQYKFMALHQKILKPLPRFVRKTGASIVSSLPNAVLNKGFSFASALGKKGKERFTKFASANSFAEQYIQQVAIFNEEEQQELLGKKNNLYSKYQEKYFSDKNSNFLGKCQRLDLKESMVDDLLMKLDKNAMAFSIEGRVPFLDGRIMDLSAKLPDSYKLQGSNNKIILRSAVKDILPPQTCQRKKKHFFVPIESWLNEELSSLKEQLLSKEFIDKQEIFKATEIEKIIKGMKDSRLFYARQIWSLLVFQIWYQEYIQHEKIRL